MATKTPKPPATLVDRLSQAAAAAIKMETPTLSWRPGTVRGVVVELDVDGNGHIREARSYVQRVLGTRPTSWSDEP
jgi:hypothetical protein